MSDDLVDWLTAWGESAILANCFMGPVSARETCADAAAEITRLRAMVEAADVLASEVRRRAGWTDLNTALATYQQKREGGE